MKSQTNGHNKKQKILEEALRENLRRRKQPPVENYNKKSDQDKS